MRVAPRWCTATISANRSRAASRLPARTSALISAATAESRPAGGACAGRAAARARVRRDVVLDMYTAVRGRRLQLFLLYPTGLQAVDLRPTPPVRSTSSYCHQPSACARSRIGRRPSLRPGPLESQHGGALRGRDPPRGGAARGRGPAPLPDGPAHRPVTERQVLRP